MEVFHFWSGKYKNIISFKLSVKEVKSYVETADTKNFQYKFTRLCVNNYMENLVRVVDSAKKSTRNANGYIQRLQLINPHKQNLQDEQ